MEYILWGTKVGDADWQEQVITATKDKNHLENAKKWATENGFDRLRVTTFNFEKPDFREVF